LDKSQVALLALLVAQIVKLEFKEQNVLLVLLDIRYKQTTSSKVLVLVPVVQKENMQVQMDVFHVKLTVILALQLQIVKLVTLDISWMEKHAKRVLVEEIVINAQVIAKLASVDNANNVKQDIIIIM